MFAAVGRRQKCPAWAERCPKRNERAAGCNGLVVRQIAEWGKIVFILVAAVMVAVFGCGYGNKSAEKITAMSTNAETVKFSFEDADTLVMDCDEGTEKTGLEFLPLGYEKILNQQFELQNVFSGNAYFEEFIKNIKWHEKKPEDTILFRQKYHENNWFYYPLKWNHHIIMLSENIINSGFFLCYTIAPGLPQSEQNIFLISINNQNALRVFSYFRGEGGWRSRLFYIDNQGIIHIKDNRLWDNNEDDYEFISESFKYQLTPEGNFIRYYAPNGMFSSDTERGLVKNHTCEGKWIEMKINWQIYSRYFSDLYTYSYLEAYYENGLQIGVWRFYKLEQEYDNYNRPIISTQRKGELLYTETYENGKLISRELISDKVEWDLYFY